MPFFRFFIFFPLSTTFSLRFLRYLQYLTMSCTIKPLLKSSSMAYPCLASFTSTFSARASSYPNLHLLHPYSSMIPKSLSLKKTERSSSVVAYVAKISDWAQQEDSSMFVGDEEDDEQSSWENEASDVDESASEGEGDVEGFYQEPSEDAKIFVGNLAYDIDSEKLAQLFDPAGVVEIAEVIYSRETNQSRGFGFVTMSTVQEAEKAVEMFHRYDLNGRLLTVNKAAPKGSRPERVPGSSFGQSSNNIFVGNLPWSVDNNRLKQFFSKYGNVVDARVVMDRVTGRSRGFGFVTMSAKEEQDDAIAYLHGQILDGRSIIVNAAEGRPRPGY